MDLEIATSSFSTEPFASMPPQEDGSDVSRYSLLPLNAPSKITVFHDWKKVFPVQFSAGVGVTLQEPTFEITSDDECRIYTCSQLHDTRSHRNFTHLNSVDHFSPFLWMVQQKSGDETKQIFFSMMCNCVFCNRKVDIFRLKPISRSVTFDLLNEEKQKSIELTFYPGVTDLFNLTTEANLGQVEHVIYFSNFFKLSTQELMPFQQFTSALSTMEYYPPEQLEVWTAPKVVTTQIVPMAGFPSRYVRQEQEMETNMMFGSSDDKYISCHQCILSCHSKTVWEELAKKDRNKEEQCVVFNVSVPAVAVEAFLDFIYYTNTTLLESSTLEICYGVLRLASDFQIMALIGYISKILMGKLDNVGWTEVVLVQKLRNFLRAAAGKIQILVWLKQRVCFTLVRLLRKQEASRIEWGGVDSTDILHPLLDMLGRQTEKDGKADSIIQELIRVIKHNEM
ncbi:unnamed protein product [Orchesella dallaii]|uniref:BTB domain-containing protein n=1 Tax=Orchesella dallaii TaxID=48710 RepID=A0ABP1QVR7_9HEXA